MEWKNIVWYGMYYNHVFHLMRERGVWSGDGNFGVTLTYCIDE